MTTTAVAIPAVPAPAAGILQTKRFSGSGPGPRGRGKVPAARALGSLPTRAHGADGVVAAPAKVGRDGVAGGTPPGHDHPTVLLALPGLDPARACVGPAEGQDGPLGIGTAQVGKATATLAAVALGGVVGHWVLRGKVLAAGLACTVGSAGVLLAGVGCTEGSSTAAGTGLVGVAGAAAAGHGQGEDRPDEQADHLHPSSVPYPLCSTPVLFITETFITAFIMIIRM